MSHTKQTMELAASYCEAVKRSKSQTDALSSLPAKLDYVTAATVTRLFEEWTLWDTTAFRIVNSLTYESPASLPQVCEWRSGVERKLSALGIHLQGASRVKGYDNG